MQANLATRSPQILIVDDHVAIRNGIRSLLEARPQWHVCGEAIDGIDAVNKVKSLKPDVVLMDVSMPRMDGLTAMRIVQRESPRSHVIIVTQDDTAPLSQQGLPAEGYVLKSNLNRDLIRTIDRVLASDQSDPRGARGATNALPRRPANVSPIGPARPSIERSHSDTTGQVEQLRLLVSQLQREQDGERRRIAHELHDSAGQLLAVLRLNLGQIRGRMEPDVTARRLFEQCEQMVEQLDKEIRSMSQRLHPPLLDESGLPSAIRWYARGLSERGDFDLDLDIAADFGRLTPNIEITLFRIVEDCIATIRDDAGSRRAVVRLSRDADAVHVDVRDEGKGTARDRLVALWKKTGGAGIAGIRERVRRFDGTMNVESTNRGTRISVMLPVPRSTPPNHH